MKEAKVLFIAQEITPYLPESEIANICRNLPQGIQDRGHEIRTLCLSTVLLTSVVINCTR
jgi:starch synthase